MPVNFTFTSLAHSIFILDARAIEKSKRETIEMYGKNEMLWKKAGHEAIDKERASERV